MQLIWSVAIALLLAPATFAQPFFFGDAAPLTTTRYAAESGMARLVTNGTSPYLLWTQHGKVRLTLVQGDLPGAGRPVLEGTQADAVWTGSHFVVVALQSSRYVARLVGANGEPLGASHTISEGADGAPRLAFDGARVLLVWGEEPVRTLLLSRDGVPLDEPRVAPIEPATALDTAVTARAGEMLLAVAARRGVSMATLHANGAWARHDRPAPDLFTRDIATAASAADQLTIWTNGGGPMQASFGPPGAAADFTLSGTNGATRVGVTWDGKDYIYAYRIGGRIHFRYFNAAFAFASVEAAPDSPVELVSVNGRSYVAFYANRADRAIRVRDVLTAGTGEAGAYAARTQVLQSTASSITAALIVWHEGDRELWAGVRTYNGAWYEQRIPNVDEQALLSASDGAGFAIVQATPLQGWSATLLDPQGNILATSPRVPFYPTGIAWADDAYVVVGLDAAQRLVGSRLALTGSVTAPVILAMPRAGRKVEWGRVAARDGELLVVWMDYYDGGCPAPPCLSGYLSDVLGARFTPSLQRLDTQSLLLADLHAVHPDVVWEGTRYVIAWRNYRTQALEYRTMRANAAVSGVSTVAGVTVVSPRVTLVPGGVAFTANDGNVVFLREGVETVAKLGVNAAHALATAAPRLVYVQSLPRDEMPYHGASRLNVRIGDVVPLGPKPSAPRITRADLAANGIMTVEWSAPPEAVNGYRVEYRVDDGLWNELDEWFDARTRRLTIRQWRGAQARYQFRVRAVNDGGFGPYSNPATVRTRKVRAVR